MARIYEAPTWPQHGAREEELVGEVVRSGLWWRNEGKAVARLEQTFAELEDAPHIVGVTNGTHALELALAVCDARPGRAVVLPATTFFSTLSAVQRSGALPILADVDSDTWQLDTASAAAVADNHDVATLLPTHYGGAPSDLVAARKLAAQLDATLVQDAAHGPGIRSEDAPLVASGGIVCWSFQHSKLLPAGEGGAIGTADERLYRRALHLQNCGRVPGAPGYDHLEPASNYRMPETTGALLLAQVERYPELAARRASGASQLRTRLGEINGLTLQAISPEGTSSHYLVQARLTAPGATANHRDRLVRRLSAHGVPVARTYPPLCDLTAYTVPGDALDPAEVRERCPNAVAIGATGISLHHRVLLSPPEEIDFVADLVADAVGNVLADTEAPS